MSSVECTDCGASIDTIEDTHYRVSEESRPVKAHQNMEMEDWFERGWVVCESCISEVIDL